MRFGCTSLRETADILANPNPNNNTKENDTGMKLNIELYLKVDFVGSGRVYKRPISYNPKRKSNTYGSSRLLVILITPTPYIYRARGPPGKMVAVKLRK